ncbi:MAG: hypothetical protein H0U70_11755 [Tatlockia sp.]|nr:hypothetical protein [Tatlockia sp.]
MIHTDELKKHLAADGMSNLIQYENRLSTNNFTIWFQEMLETTYLQPFGEIHKENLKDGSIERIIHGAQHASNATLWALAIHNLLQNLIPEYVNQSLKTIANYLNLEEESVLCFILMTMGCHDTARQGEGEDDWEKQSAEKTIEILKKLGLKEKQAKLFGAAIEFKDNPREYEFKLPSGIYNTDLSKFDYIRMIINLGDNLDLMRCESEFKSKYIFDTLASIEGFNESHHELIMELIKAIHQFTFEQHDMLFDCTIYDLHGKKVASHLSNFSRKEKVKYEHAENVFCTIFEEALKNPTIEPLIKHFKVPKAQKYQGESAFTPFIHGTNSSIFSILAKTEFNIMSPLEMINEYLAVPLSGELTKGGYDILGSQDEHRIGATCFGIMSANNCNAYTLKKILSNYANKNLNSGNNCLLDFRNSVENGVSQAFSNINLLLIYFVRARQKYNSMDDIISAKELSTLQEQIQAMFHFYYFLQLLGSYIHPNFAALMKSGMKLEDIKAATDQVLRLENIIDRIIKYQINMQAIANPTVDNLQKALKVLEYPKNCTIKVWEHSEEKYINKNLEFPITQFFCLEPNYPSHVRDFNEVDYAFYRMTQNSLPSYQINALLKDYLSGGATSLFFIKLGSKTHEYLATFRNRVRLFEKIISSPQDLFQFSELDRYFLENQFPVILVSENENKITMHRLFQEEYRSRSCLKIGDDIKMIATDTQEHRFKIMKYLELHHISTVQVVLFNDLQEIKNSYKKSSTPYHHSDGVPSLKWLSAQKVSSNDLTFFHTNIKSASKNGNNSIYSEKNSNEVENLLEDAKQYQAINFT